MNKSGKICIVTSSSILMSLLFVMSSIENLNGQLSNNGDIICGTTVEQNIKLTSDLDCLSDGLIVKNQRDLTIDLNGHSIIGPGTTSQKSGIDISYSTNIQIIGNGTIKNFYTGIFSFINSDLHISSTNFQNNEAGIFFTSSKNSIIQNSTFNKNNIGTIIKSGLGVDINNNAYNSNRLAGISMVNSNENKITANNVNGAVNGIFVDGNSENNVIEANTMFDNPGVDLNNGNGLPTSVNNNAFNNNICNLSVPGGLCTLH